MFAPPRPASVLSVTEEGNLLACDFNSKQQDPTMVYHFYVSDLFYIFLQVSYHHDDYANGEDLTVDILFNDCMSLNCMDFDIETETLACGTDGQNVLFLQNFIQ